MQVGGIYNQVLGGVKGVQVGGMANMVQREATGIQVGGLANIVQENLKGIQVGGLYNQAKTMNGIQVGGLANINPKEVIGIQVAGLYNHAQSMGGIQVAGLANNSMKKMNGLQIAGLINYTRHLKGVQIALINIADTSEGYSLGLINIIRKGYHKLSIFSNDLHPVNLAFRTGSYHFYSILTAGTSIDQNNKSYSVGYGVGSEFNLSKKFTFNPEITEHWVYTGDSTFSSIARAQLNVHYKASKLISIYAGPSFSVMYSDRSKVAGYKSDFVNGAPSVIFSNKIFGWIGWNIGISLF